MTDFNLTKRAWWSFLEEDLQELFLEAIELDKNVAKWDEKYHDYAFVVFPAAKAYEGFLKKEFFNRGFISKDDYYGKKFRIGRALNPSLENIYRHESVYDKICNFCGGKELADRVWDTWRLGRNLLFHWFPEEKNAISFSEARDRLMYIFATMDEVFKECKI